MTTTTNTSEKRLPGWVGPTLFILTTGIVVVPLTGFYCAHPGFRVTLLETDDTKRAWIFKTLREAIDQYLAG